MMNRWKVLFQTRHYGHAYAMLGLGFDDFVEDYGSRDVVGLLTADVHYVATDGKYRVSAFVDDWGHSCRLVEYAVGEVSCLELAAVHERLARELRIQAVADRLYDERHPGTNGWRAMSIVEWGELHDAATELIA